MIERPGVALSRFSEHAGVLPSARPFWHWSEAHDTARVKSQKPTDNELSLRQLRWLLYNVYNYNIVV